MAILYTDTFGGDLENQAYPALRRLIRVFLKRLATTTNDIPMTRRCILYRLISYFLNRGVEPLNLTIISFNQDIQAEKALDAIGSTKGRHGETIMSFPGCYRLPTGVRVSMPRRSAPQFERDYLVDQGVSVLKLHGSLNWYSRHYTRDPQKRTLFNASRRLNVTTRKTIETSMNMNVKARDKFTFPVVIPPVVHKVGILHKNLLPVWALAQKRLSEADRVVILGYSCPQNDWESANLIRRALTANNSTKRVSILDPDPGVLLRYINLGSLSRVSYHKSALSFLTGE